MKRTIRHQIRRRLLFTGLAILSAALGACGGDKPDPAASAPMLTVLVSDSVQKDVPLTIDMVGTTLGTQDVPIRTRVEGFMETMNFTEGTFVKAGDLLYTIDPQPFQAKLVEAQSKLASAQTHQAKAKADLDRIRPLAEMNAVSQQDLDSAVAQEAAARASVRASEAAVELANIELSYTRLSAPIDGLIGLTQAKPGEFVGREPNPVVLNVLSDVNPIRVRFAISEREYLILARNYIARNDPRDEDHGRGSKDDAGLTLILADGSKHPDKGGVVAVSQSINPETGTYSIEAAFPNPERIILPGQFARVRAVYETLKDAIVIPRQAVIELQGLFSVYVVAGDGTVSAKTITKGPENDKGVVIESGLSAGETLIIEGLQRVRPGMKVNTQPWTPPEQG